MYISLLTHNHYVAYLQVYLDQPLFLNSIKKRLNISAVRFLQTEIQFVKIHSFNALLVSKH